MLKDKRAADFDEMNRVMAAKSNPGRRLGIHRAWRLSPREHVLLSYAAVGPVVLDRELSTLGYSLPNFGYHAMMRRMPGDIVAGLGGVDPAPFGLPTEADYIATYCARTGRPASLIGTSTSPSIFFGLVAIFYGIKRPVLRDIARNAEAKQRAQALRRLAALARSGPWTGGRQFP